MTTGGIDGDDCGGCGNCGCGKCGDRKIPETLPVTISGATYFTFLYDSDCNGTFDATVTSFDPRLLEGTHDFTPIWHNGSYKTGYDTGAMGEVDVSVNGSCSSVYEKELGPGIDLLFGGGGCSGSPPSPGITNETLWLRNAKPRVRLYFYPYLPGDPYDYQVVAVTIAPNETETGFIEQEFFRFDFNVTDEPFFCDSDETYDFTQAYSDPYWAGLQMLGANFVSETDTRFSGWNFLLATNAADSRGSEAGTGDVTWSFGSSVNRISAVA